MATFYATYAGAGADAAVSATIVGPFGQALMASSIPVVIASDQTPVPVTGSITATNPSVGTTGTAVPASATMIGGTDGTNLRAAHISAAGVVSVDGSGSTQPVSGTVTANQGTAGASAWLVDGSAHTQPVSGTVAVTQSTSPWIVAGGGAAGTAATGVVTVQGITSMTPLLVNGSGSTQPVSGTVTANQGGSWTVTANAGTNLNTSALALDASVTGLQVSQGSTTSGEKGPLVQGAVTTAAPSYTTAQTSPLSLTTGGALRVDASGSTQPVSGTVAVTQSTSPWVVAGGGTAGTAATGVVTIQGIASGTVVPVTVSTAAPVTTTTAAFQAEGAVAFGSITASYVTLFTPSAATKILQMRNNMNASVAVSLDAGSTTNYILDAGDAVSLDLLSNALSMGATAIQVKYAVGAPTSGSFRINACH